MWQAYELKEPEISTVDEGVLRCNGLPQELVMCSRLLSGSIDIEEAEGGVVHRLRYNHGKRKPNKSKINDQYILKNIFYYTIPHAEASAYLDRVKSENIGFYRPLRREIVHAVLNHKLKHGLDSFVHVYRIIEKSAIAFPLVYVSSSNDFVSVHNNMSKFYTEKSGELRVLERFSSILSDTDENIRELNVDFKYPGANLDEMDRAFDQIRHVAGSFLEYIDFDEINGKFRVPYKNTASFLVHCRNRMFHYSNDGQRNIDFSSIGSAGGLCFMLADAGLHWLAITLSVIAAKRASYNL